MDRGPRSRFDPAVSTAAGSVSEETGKTGASLEGLDEAALTTFRERSVAQAPGTISGPMHFAAAARAGGRATIIACSIPRAGVEQMLGDAADQVAIEELPTGHWPMFPRPADTAALLHELAT